MANYERKSPGQFLRIDGKNEFYEVMIDGLKSIEKIVINFVQYDDSKEAGNRKKASIACYLDVFEAYVLAKDIFSGFMANEAKNARAKQKEGGYKYCSAIYTSLGGTSVANLAKNGNDRKDGKALSRQLKITPGDKAPWILSAESGPGEEAGSGIIVPKYKDGRPEQIIRIPMDNNTVKKFAAALELASIGFSVEKVNNVVNSVNPSKMAK